MELLVGSGGTGDRAMQIYSPPLLNALNRDTDRKFTRIYHQSLNLQHFSRKCIIQLMAIVTATTGTLTS